MWQDNTEQQVPFYSLESLENKTYNIVCRGFIKGRTPGILTSIEDGLTI